MSTIFFLHDPADPKEGTTIKKWGLVILGRTKKIDKTSMGDEDLGMGNGWMEMRRDVDPEMDGVLALADGLSPLDRT